MYGYHKKIFFHLRKLGLYCEVKNKCFYVRYSISIWIVFLLIYLFVFRQDDQGYLCKSWPFIIFLFISLVASHVKKGNHQVRLVNKKWWCSTRVNGGYKFCVSLSLHLSDLTWKIYKIGLNASYQVKKLVWLEKNWMVIICWLAST